MTDSKKMKAKKAWLTARRNADRAWTAWARAERESLKKYMIYSQPKSRKAGGQ